MLGLIRMACGVPTSRILPLLITGTARRGPEAGSILGHVQLSRGAGPVREIGQRDVFEIGVDPGRHLLLFLQ